MSFDMEGLSLAFFGQVFSIVLIDIVLSGDNAVVIGMAARSLSPRQRKRAIVFGALGAIGLRIAFTAMAAILLLIPLLRFAGGVVLVWIAWKLLRQDADEHNDVAEAKNLLEAIRIIVMADVIMSLDNILAVGAASHGNIALLLFGLFLSIGIIMFCSNVVAILMNRLPILVFAGGAVLLWVAAEMMAKDTLVGGILTQALGQSAYHTYETTLPPAVTLGVLALYLLLHRHRLLRRLRVAAHAPEHGAQEVEVH